jgi:hypothetical protein
LTGHSAAVRKLTRGDVLGFYRGAISVEFARGQNNVSERRFACRFLPIFGGASRLKQK